MSESIWCQECGSQNDTSAKFCSNCGNELALPRNEQNVCNKCGHENDHHANYCETCGSKLSQKARKRVGQVSEQARKERWSSAKASNRSLNFLQGRGLVVLGSLIVGLFIIYLLIDGNRQNSSNSAGSFQPSIEKKTNNMELENKVYEVASKFVCACGSCGEEPLESCTCQTAQEERQFIRQALQQGQSVDEGIIAVNMNFGWIKDEYRSQYGDGKLSLNVKPDLNQNLDAGKSTDQEKVRIATVDDRMDIISRFACSCGQCDYDELKDCECDHPGGAKEVKQFVDDKIQSGKYSVDRIIEFVEHQYAARIR